MIASADIAGTHVKGCHGLHGVVSVSSQHCEPVFSLASR